MRTTVTLDEDVAQQIRRVMSERGAGFKETVNELLRRGLRAHEHVEAYVAPTFALGVRPGIDLDHALRLAAELEDAEFVRKHEMGK
jgi:hypothetical protein